MIGFIKMADDDSTKYIDHKKWNAVQIDIGFQSIQR